MAILSIRMSNFWISDKKRTAKEGSSTSIKRNEKQAEEVHFQRFVREQLLKLKERGLSIPVATL